MGGLPGVELNNYIGLQSTPCGGVSICVRVNLKKGQMFNINSLVALGSTEKPQNAVVTVQHRSPDRMEDIENNIIQTRAIPLGIWTEWSTTSIAKKDGVHYVSVHNNTLEMDTTLFVARLKIQEVAH